MKIKRFTAPDMRTAIRMVRDEQGPDAVILSTRNVADGIEMVAAVDYDEALVQQALRQADETRTPPVRQPEPPVEIKSKVTPISVDADLVNSFAVDPETGTPMDPFDDEPVAANRGFDPNIDKLQCEVTGLRELLESRLGAIDDLAFAGQAPTVRKAARMLEALGVRSEWSRSIVSKLPSSDLPSSPENMALKMFARRLPVEAEDVLAKHNVIALVGPTGAGKTTTIAKLAALRLMDRGAGPLTLVTTDSQRIGAQEQLRTYGRILGVPVQVAEDARQLQEIVHERERGGLILIDTAGIGPRDEALHGQLEALLGLPEVCTLLCLPANAHPDDLDATIARFRPAAPSGCVITKADETRRLGSVLGAAMMSELPIAYLADGQNVPEDLHRDSREQLIRRAFEQAGPFHNKPHDDQKEVARACA